MPIQKDQKPVLVLPERHNQYVKIFDEKSLLRCGSWDHASKNSSATLRKSSLFQNNASPENNSPLFIDHKINDDSARIEQKEQIKGSQSKFNDHAQNQILQKLEISKSDVGIPLKKSAYVASIISKHAQAKGWGFLGLKENSISNIFQKQCISWIDYINLFKEALNIQKGNGKYWGSESCLLDYYKLNFQEEVGKERQSYMISEDTGDPNQIHRYALDNKYHSFVSYIMAARRSIATLENNLINNLATFEISNLFKSFRDISRYSINYNDNIQHLINYQISKIINKETSITDGLTPIISAFFDAGVDSFTELLKSEQNVSAYLELNSDLANVIKSPNCLAQLCTIISKVRSKVMVQNVIEYNKNLENKKGRNKPLLTTELQGNIGGIIVGLNHAKHILEWQKENEYLKTIFEVLNFDEISSLTQEINDKALKLMHDKLDSEANLEKKSEQYDHNIYQDNFINFGLHRFGDPDIVSSNFNDPFGSFNLNETEFVLELDNENISKQTDYSTQGNNKRKRYNEDDCDTIKDQYTYCTTTKKVHKNEGK